ncbi:hypothetical protein NMX13_12860 [Dickeya zeae]|nr:hypothetical protein NMX13_12860 [Dickeya zeae]
MTQENHDQGATVNTGERVETTVTGSVSCIPNHGYLIWAGELKNGTFIGTVSCDGSICGGLPVCKG